MSSLETPWGARAFKFLAHKAFIMIVFIYEILYFMYKENMMYEDSNGWFGCRIKYNSIEKYILEE